MKAIIYRQYGGPEVLEYAEVPAPKLSQNGVLIRVQAAALNPADHMLQAGPGDSIMDAWFRIIPGWDVAGVVESVGAGVTEFAEGDEVIDFVREEILHHGTCGKCLGFGIQPGPQTEECELGTGCGAAAGCGQTQN
jgi:NADPH:quinone reductase-like Zn-dependent oxidoreductase